MATRFRSDPTYVTYSRWYKQRLRPHVIKIIMGNGAKIESTGIGDWEGVSEDSSTKVILKNVVIVPRLVKRLLSAHQLLKQGASVNLGPRHSYIQAQGQSVKIHTEENIPYVNFHSFPDSYKPANSYKQCPWHVTIGSQLQTLSTTP